MTLTSNSQDLSSPLHYNFFLSFTQEWHLFVCKQKKRTLTACCLIMCTTKQTSNDSFQTTGVPLYPTSAHCNVYVVAQCCNIHRREPGQLCAVSMYRAPTTRSPTVQFQLLTAALAELGKSGKIYVAFVLSRELSSPLLFVKIPPETEMGVVFMVLVPLGSSFHPVFPMVARSLVCCEGESKGVVVAHKSLCLF